MGDDAMECSIGLRSVCPTSRPAGEESSRHPHRHTRTHARKQASKQSHTRTRAGRHIRTLRQPPPPWRIFGGSTCAAGQIGRGHARRRRVSQPRRLIRRANRPPALFRRRPSSLGRSIGRRYPRVDHTGDIKINQERLRCGTLSFSDIYLHRASSSLSTFNTTSLSLDHDSEPVAPA